MKIVEVQWRDAWFDSVNDGWDEEKTEHVMVTIGYVVSEGPHRLALAQELDPDGNPRCVTNIPLVLIKGEPRILS